MGRNIKTKKEIEKSKALGIENNKLRWFYVGHNFHCEEFTLLKAWYEKIGTFKENGVWKHNIKKRDTKLRFTITDKDFNRIKEEFKKSNPHLF